MACVADIAAYLELDDAEAAAPTAGAAEALTANDVVDFLNPGDEADELFMNLERDLGDEFLVELAQATERENHAKAEAEAAEAKAKVAATAAAKAAAAKAEAEAEAVAAKARAEAEAAAAIELQTSALRALYRTVIAMQPASPLRRRRPAAAPDLEPPSTKRPDLRK